MKIMTEKELNLFKIFIEDYESPEECLSDNFTCQCIEDLREATGLSNHELGGTLSSLQNKGIIYLEDRDGPFCESKNKTQQMNFEPDLYWVSDDFLESLDPKLNLKTL